MSLPVMLYLIGSGLVLLLIRLGGGTEDPLFQAQAIGWLLVALSVWKVFSVSPQSEGAEASNRWLKVCLSLGVLSLLGVLGLSLDQIDLY